MELIPRFSVIIPAYNEEGYLPRLLSTIEVAQRKYHGGKQAIEIIVADNVSTDRTAALAAERGCTVVHVEKRVIGATRNGGAKAARGEILCFIDADTQVHPNTFNTIDQLMSTGRYVAGAVGIRLERMSLGLAFTYLMVLPLRWFLDVDAGVVFCRRSDFELMGGYHDSRLFAEDVEFLQNMKKLGRPRKQKLANNTHSKAIVSVRKFDERGDWHMFYMWYDIFFKERSLRKFVDKYWYTRHNPNS